MIGKHSKQVPKDRRKNLLFRRSIIHQAKNRPAAQAELRRACSEDVLFYVNVFVWQFNPRKKGGGEVGPFVTWPFQDEALAEILRCIKDDEDLLIEKSREMGASWLCLIAMEWLWHFRPWQKFLMISRNEAAVEDDDPDSLFWKIDFVHRHLPDWLMPRLKRRKLYYGNLDNESTITGQASTGKAGVGGRASAMFIDEFSQVKEDYEVLHRTSDTTGCRIFNGTHRGTGTAFHELSERVDIRKLVMHWSQHPDKSPGLYRYSEADNKVEVIDKYFPYPPEFDFVMQEAPAGGPYPGLRSPWYDRECGRKGSPRAVAMDLDIDPGGSVAQFFNAITIRLLQRTYCTPPYWEGDVHYDQDTGKLLGLVKFPGGPLKLWIQPKADNTVPPDEYGAGADLATGSGATNSCLSIASARTGEKVAEYATPHCVPERFAAIACAVCWLFKNDHGEPAYFAWEHHGPGQIFGKRVVENQYPRIYYRETHQGLGGKLSAIPGWFPAPEQKRLLLEEYRAALDSRQYLNRSEIALQECLPYRYNNQGNVEHPHEEKSDDPTGARVNHGDRTVADALSWKTCKSFGKLAHVKKEASNVTSLSLAWRREQALLGQKDGGW